ncbi:MAG: hypothetical protein ACI9CO_000051 [Candidatus Azotimanducaceae bacterium]|jgi:hypothetical protein
MNICTFTTHDIEDKLYEVSVSAEENYGSVLVKFSIFEPDTGKSIVSSEIDYDLSEGRLSIIGINMEVPAYASCLLAGGVGHLVQEIMACRKNGKKSPIALINCLRAKGHSMGSSLANIAITCCAL